MLMTTLSEWPEWLFKMKPWKRFYIINEGTILEKNLKEFQEFYFIWLAKEFYIGIKFSVFKFYLHFQIFRLMNIRTFEFMTY